jgi:hypothetical protein
MNPASPRSRRQGIARALDWSGRNRVAVTVERMATLGADEEKSIEEAVDRLDEQVVRRLLVSAAEWHEDVARSVRLAGAGAEERIAVLKAMVDNELRTRRFLDYGGSSSWARDASPIVDALAEEVAVEPSAELVVLLQRAAGHLVKVILRADDSNGMIGDLARRVLELHRQASAFGLADPAALAKWMVRFAFEDQDFFAVDPVAYVDALGEKGLAVYRREVAKRSVPVDDEVSARMARVRELHAPFPSFAARYAAERLAVIDRDADRLVELLGGDLSSPHQFTRVAEAMVELGRPDDALAWARRGIAETDGWQVAKLYDLAAGLLGDSEDLAAVVGLRRHHHERAPSASTYAALQTAARDSGTWDDEEQQARAALAQQNLPGLIDVLLADGEPDAAWQAGIASDRELRDSQWFRLAEAREPTHPADALGVYLRVADVALLDANKRAYRQATSLLKTARRAANEAGLVGMFGEKLADLRERHRRRPTLIAMLDKAGLR